MKKALITVKLVPEASEVSDSQIEKEIRKDSQISWCAEIEKVEIQVKNYPPKNSLCKEKKSHVKNV